MSVSAIESNDSDSSLRPHELVQRPVIRVQTVVSNYEQVSGGLTAGVIITGLLAGVLFLLWYSLLKVDRMVPTAIDPAFAGETSNPEGVAEDIEEPGVEEFPEVQEPQLAEALESVDVASTVRANDSVGGDAPAMGTGSGLGDKRAQGIGTGGTDKNEPWKRWELRYKVSTLTEYAKQLDFFKIELAGVQKVGDNIAYLTNIAAASPKVRSGSRKTEKRIYFSHTIAQLRKWDLNLLQKANVTNLGDRLPMQFYPADVIQQLYSLENAQLTKDNRKVPDIKRTVFNVEGSEGNYRFVLEKITYLNN